MGQHSLFVSSVKKGTRCIIRPIMRLVHVFTPETSNERLPKFIQTDNVSSSTKTGSMALPSFSHAFWKLACIIIVVDVITLPDAILCLHKSLFWGICLAPIFFSAILITIHYFTMKIAQTSKTVFTPEEALSIWMVMLSLV